MMHIPRFRLRSAMLGIAFLALILTVFAQTILLRRAAVREELARATAEHERALAEAAARRAQTQVDFFRRQAEGR
jgi:hypothetical protein